MKKTNRLNKKNNINTTFENEKTRLMFQKFKIGKLLTFLLIIPIITAFITNYLVRKCPPKTKEVNNKIKNTSEQIYTFTKEKFSNNRTKNHRILKFILSSLSSLIIAIIGGYFATSLAENQIKNTAIELNESESITLQLNTFENIYIGCSKEWLDERLGAPTFKYNYTYNDKNDFTNIDLNLICCVYVTDIAVVKAYFDEAALSCNAFFVTISNEKYKGKVNLPNPYQRFVDYKSIGKFSYYDILNGPTCIGGGISNGNVRTFYGEVYRYFSAGNYYYFAFGTLDYGIYPTMKLEIEIKNWDDEIIESKTKILGVHNIKNRKIYYPNTFGLATSSFNDKITFNLLYDSRGFDSFQLKKNPYDYIDDNATTSNSQYIPPSSGTSLK